MRRFYLLACLLGLGFATTATAQTRLPESLPAAPTTSSGLAAPQLPPVPLPATVVPQPIVAQHPTPAAPVAGPSTIFECPPLLPGQPGSTQPGTSGLSGQAQAAVQDAVSPFAQGTEGGGLASRSFDNPMFGDFGGVFYRRTEFVTRSVQVGSTPRVVGFDSQTGTNIIVQDPVFANRTVPVAVNLPLNGRYSGFKMSDQEAPRPMDRVYFAYSYYQGVNSTSNPGIASVDQHRQTVGFEKTLLNGNMSLGLRIPFVQTVGEGTIGGGNVGDLTVSVKYAFVNDPNTGAVRSAGLIITTPTGTADAILLDGTSAPHSTLLQPWVGFSQPLSDRLYTQGFSSILVPTSGSREPTIMFNSLSFGYWLLRNINGDSVTGLAPVTEIHVNTPLNNRDPSSMVYVQDQLNLTHGLHLMLPRAVIGAAITYPLLSPRPFNAEGLFTVNFRF